MKIINLLFLLGLGVFQQVIAQQDTTWFDSDWKETTMDSAAFYRPAPQPKDDGYWMVDYYISGARQMEGYSKVKDREVFEGTVKWYNENGQLEQKADYQMGVLNGVFVKYYNGKPFATAKYEQGRVSSGEMLSFNEAYQCYRLLAYQEGKVVQEKVFLEMPCKGMIVDSRIVKGDEGNLLLTKYYDGKGDVLGEFEMDADESQNVSAYNGTQISYFYDPLLKKRAISYEHGEFQNGTVWYPSGEVREKILVENDTVYTTYFDEDGNQLGDLVGRMEEGQGWYDLHGSPISGVMIKFKENYLHKTPAILYTEQYRNGLIIEKKEFRENGNLQQMSVFDEHGLQKLVSYDEGGQVTHELIYKDGQPFEGTSFDQRKNVLTTYVQGELTAQTMCYYDGAKFESREGDRSVFYDHEGNEMGVLTYKANKYGKKEPYNGTLYQLNYQGKLYIEEDYHNGNRTRYAYYSFSGEKGRNSIESETFYNESGKKTQYKYYYKNGVLREDITYVDGYEKETATFYDKSGDLLAEMVYLPKSHGAEYEFFSDTSLVRYIRKYDDNGTLIYKKSYAENYTRRDRNGKYPVFLEEEIDYNGKASFYDLDGELLGEAVYKDGEPWEGTVKSGTVYEYRLTPYQEGAKQGEEKLFFNPDGGVPKISEQTGYANGERHGKHNTYYRNGTLESEENYSRGLLDGECVYYTEHGEVRNEITYSSGNPTDGELISFQYNDQKSLVTKKSFYESGECRKIEMWKEDRLFQEMVTATNQLEATIYDPTGKELAVFEVSDVANKTGEVTYYQGISEAEERGTFEDGLPVSGTFYLNEYVVGYENTKGDKSIDEVKLLVTADQYNICALNKEGEVLFSVSEKKGLEKSYFLEKILDPYSFYYNVMPEF
ncbi:hypothetical protein FKX85_12170 [Echinicola soli]|uniref:Antitoxin component YwqK of the YwqJK toxin-antitoxin module n=1 Tax=Echinicola soli TaxID=2591634 RepID=A0A514CIU5_9BACT|nr:hypothetical protein [Echinicola soli]QDH79749.1 hypothetical protein FKX85_12170 [Echinicola soli]